MVCVAASMPCLASWACGALLLLMVGCSTASSLGLPVAAGPHRLTRDAQTFREAARFPISLPRELAKGVLPEYRVEAGDVLIVEPDSFDSTIRLPGDQPVQPDGTIELGRYGRLLVAGMTVAEMERVVRQHIETHMQAESNGDQANGPRRSRGVASVSIRLISRESKVFYVVGEVNAPGTYPLIGRETILDAIMTAGGLTDRANEHKLIFVRPTAPGQCRLVLPICYRQIVQLGDTSTNYQVMPGDRIYVPSMTFCDDVIQFLKAGHEASCPRCARPQRTCILHPSHSPNCVFCGDSSSCATSG